jgi:hypothetical protein
MNDMSAFQKAIAAIESGGNYGAVGPVTGGDRPYGKYQVMGANVGPWTQQALGRPLTAQEFLSSPAVQDAVFNQVFGDYVGRYGPEGAAQAWLGGPGAVGKTGRQDVLGTSVGEYGQRFASGLSGAHALTTPAATAEGVQAFEPPAFGDMIAGDPLAGLGLGFIQRAEERRAAEDERERDKRRALFAQPLAPPADGLGGLYG